MSGFITTVKQQSSSQLQKILFHLFPAGKLSGREFQIGDVHGNPGDSLRFNVANGVGSDFAGDWSGDVISLWQASKGCTPLEAARGIADILGIPEDPSTWKPKPVANQSTKQKLVPLPVPSNAPSPPDRNMVDGVQLVFVKRWDYRTADGQLVGHTVRFEYPDGHPKRFKSSGKIHKEIKPQVWTEKGWMWSSLATPFPMYGAELSGNPGQLPVLLVEGEKTADAARVLIRSHVVMSWLGGPGGIKKTDWSVLAGRDVKLFPDADLPGSKCMQEIAEILEGKASTVTVINPPKFSAPGWDLADALAEGITPEAAEAFIKTAKPVEKKEPKKPKPVVMRNATYQALGYDKGRFYFKDSGGQIISFSGPGLEQTGNLFQLDTLSGWESRVVTGKDGFGKSQCLQAAAILLQECRAKGVYDPTRNRGLGAWYDRSRAVFHVGSRLLVDGIETEIEDFETDYFYEISRSIRYSLTQAPNSESSKLAEICRALTWDRPVNGTLLAGWLVAAIVCGGLDWRPHIWITGGAGSGKTWVLENIVKKVLGELALSVLGASTEAGIRQTLGADARAVIADEAESEGIKSSETMQAVLQLARQASSESNGSILKGTSDGNSKSYVNRAVFLFSSINTGIKQAADHSRITVVSLRENTKEEREKFKTVTFPLCQATITEDFCLDLRCRAIMNIGIIRENSVTFATVIAKKFNSQRHGDQLGPLLAGAFLLYSVNKISPEQAKKWVDDQDWEDPAEVGLGIPDEERLVNFIFEQVTKIRNAEKHDADYSFRQLIDFARGYINGKQSPDLSEQMQKNAIDKLGLYGLRYHVGEYGTQYVAISSSNTQLKSLLATTPWSASWNRTLSRLVGAVPSFQIRIGSKISRFTLIPL